MEIEFHRHKNGNAPYENWIKRRDATTQGRVARELSEFRRGNKQGKYLDDGVWEIKISRTKWRVYYHVKGSVAYLLRGGDKDDQDRDIKWAKKVINEASD